MNIDITRIFNILNSMESFIQNDEEKTVMFHKD